MSYNKLFEYEAHPRNRIWRYKMYEQFKALLIDELQIAEDKITPEAELLNDLGVNSIDLAELILRCEETFDVTIEDDDLHSFTTVGDIVKFLESKQK